MSIMNKFRLMPEFIDCAKWESNQFSWYESSYLVTLHEKYHYILSQIFKGFLYSSPLTILALTVERYILIVHPGFSHRFMIKRNRILFYSFLTVCTLIIPLARVIDFLCNFKDDSLVQISIQSRNESNTPQPIIYRADQIQKRGKIESVKSRPPFGSNVSGRKKKLKIFVQK